MFIEKLELQRVLIGWCFSRSGRLAKECTVVIFIHVFI